MSVGFATFAPYELICTYCHLTFRSENNLKGQTLCAGSILDFKNLFKIYFTLLLSVLSMLFCSFFRHVATATFLHHKQNIIR